VSHALNTGHVHVNQAIEHIRWTRTIFDDEHWNDEQCRTIVNEWTQLLTDFDEQQRDLTQLDEQRTRIEQDINELIRSRHEQETKLQSILCSQATYEVKRQQRKQLEVMLNRTIVFHGNLLLPSFMVFIFFFFFSSRISYVNCRVRITFERTCNNSKVKCPSAR
jgi:hypothetical protein